MATSKGTLDFSAVDCVEIKIRGKRSAIIRMVPQNGEVLDPALVRAVLGYDGRIVKILTVGEGIADNGDGSFNVTISGADFNYRSQSVVEFYGLQNMGDMETGIGNITYTPNLK